jgi:hypothetical protein
LQARLHNRDCQVFLDNPTAWQGDHGAAKTANETKTGRKSFFLPVFVSFAVLALSLPPGKTIWKVDLDCQAHCGQHFCKRPANFSWLRADHGQPVLENGSGRG